MTAQAGRITGKVMKIEGVNHWPEYQRFRGQFAEVMDERFYTLEWLDRHIHNNIFRFWSNDTSAIIAKIIEYPTGAKEVHGMIAAGELEGILELIPKAEAWGLSLGAIVAGISSREGWSRALPDYSVHQVEIRKELS